MAFKVPNASKGPNSIEVLLQASLCLGRYSALVPCLVQASSGRRALSEACLLETGSAGKSQKGGQEDQGEVKELEGTRPSYFKVPRSSWTCTWPPGPPLDPLPPSGFVLGAVREAF